MATNSNVLRLAAVSDLHCPRVPPEELQHLFRQVAESADVLALCGDLTDLGLADEARLLTRELTTAVRLPVLVVLGNHDYHAGQQDQIRHVLQDAGAHVLDGEAREVHGVGFAGVKGFAGGFGRRLLEPWGEDIIKQFVHASVEEGLKLESALARLHTPQRVALLHYAPIAGTVEGEPLEIHPFLGSSRLEEPLNRYEVTAVFHGHAHHGSPEGQTLRGAPVYNVSYTLLQQAFPKRPPFRLVEIPKTPTAGASEARSAARPAAKER